MRVRAPRDSHFSRGLLRLRTQPVEAYRVIEAEKAIYTVSRMCGLLEVSRSGFYKWRRSRDGGPSPRIHADLVEAGWTVSVNTVADSMRRQGLQGRKPKRRKGTTKQDKTAPKFPDRLKRDFTAPEANVKWCGDMTEIPTAWILGVVATP